MIYRLDDIPKFNMKITINHFFVEVHPDGAVGIVEVPLIVEGRRPDWPSVTTKNYHGLTNPPLRAIPIARLPL